MTDRSAPPSEDRPIGRKTLGVTAFLMALPATVPVLVAVEPALVPFVGPIDTADAGVLGFLIGLSVILLAVNWGFLYLIYRWINKMAAGQA